MNLALMKSSAKFPEWVTSVLLGSTLMGGYFCYQAYEHMIHPLDEILSRAWLDAIPIIYHLTAVISVLSVGPFIRRLGLKVCLVLFTFVCLAGALLALLPSPRCLLAGRFLLGLGLEPLGVATLAAAAQWLTEINRAFCLGVILSLARLGFVMADDAPLAGIVGWRHMEYACAVFSALSFFFAIVLYFRQQSISPGGAISGPSESFRLYNTLIVISTFFFASILFFRMYGDDFFIHQYNISETTAGSLIGITSLLPLFCSVFLGRLADRVNRHAWFIAGGCLLLPPAYLILAFNSGNRYSTVLALVLVGSAYAAVPTSLWSSVRKIVGTAKLLSAYSRILAVLNATLAVAYGLDFLLKNGVKSQPLIWMVGISSVIAAAASIVFTTQWTMVFEVKKDTLIECEH